ncbi:M20 aminoacylase family protein [Methylocapsa sp. S129]|uniref:M20 aminoacylase family protein n=1 Tax=Methylocapsa sp. S129 TaxID=1641869 RepID=UPI00131D57D2|nr:M20 aminoacylase family protein [Methylocapsa sp. S129]
MPINPAIQNLAADAQAWRRDIHQHPELLYDVPRTAAFVAERLKAFGCDEVATGIGRSGVVGIIRGRGPASQRTIGLRADMDALPIHETTNLAYQSTNPGKMHACGHDGHTAMLLGAARYLAQSRNFSGTAVMIFQPAEEGGGGGKAMLDDGLMERFGVQEVYGMHNWPRLPVGTFAIRKGPFLAAADRFTIDIEGRGGHAAQPHFGVDPIAAGAQIVSALQTIVARNVDPLDSCVVSVTCFHAGDTDNVIPQTAQLRGTTRTLLNKTRDFAERRITEIAKGVGAALGVNVDVQYKRGYPPTINHPKETDFAATIARKISGDSGVVTEAPPEMGAEDFSYMLEARPGAFIFVGNGDSASLHHPGYDFNDAALPYGMSYWAQLVESALAV